MVWVVEGEYWLAFGAMCDLGEECSPAPFSPHHTQGACALGRPRAGFSPLSCSSLFRQILFSGDWEVHENIQQRTEGQ